MQRCLWSLLLLLAACDAVDGVESGERDSTFETCPGEPDGLVCDLYPDDFECPDGSERTVIDCRPLCQDISTCEEVDSLALLCPGDPDDPVCDVHPDDFECPAGSERTVIDC